MKPSTFKTFVSVHTWTGLGAGFALFIAFYTGSITLFMEELEAWESYSVTAPPTQSYAQAQRLLDQVLEKKPDAAENLTLMLSTPGHPENTARWFEKLDDDSFEEHSFRLSVSSQLDTAPSKEHLAHFLYRLHYTAGLPASFGLEVLGIICLIYGVALISGIVIFLPNFMKDLFKIRPGVNKKRFWLDAHNVVGVFSLPWHIMYAWSSAILALAIYFLAPFQLVVFDADLFKLIGPELGVVETLEPSGERSEIISVEQLVTIAKRELPDLVVKRLRYTHVGDRNGMVRLSGDANADTLVSAAQVFLNTSTGEVLHVERPDSTSIGSTFYRGLYALHYADFGGYTLKIVYFVLGLGGAFLFYSGNLLWVESRRKRRTSEQPAGTSFVARLNSGVCIGTMAGVSAAFLAARSLAEFSDRDMLIELSYYGILLASTAWCLYRPVASGTRDLLYGCAVLTAAIPVFDAIFLDMPIWHSVMGGHWVIVSVDLIAAISALAFWKMARAVQARAVAGDDHSVWAHQTTIDMPTTRDEIKTN